MISSSSRFVVEGVFRESDVVHSFKMVDPVLFVFIPEISSSFHITLHLILYNYIIKVYITTFYLCNIFD